MNLTGPKIWNRIQFYAFISHYKKLNFNNLDEVKRKEIGAMMTNKLAEHGYFLKKSEAPCLTFSGPWDEVHTTVKMIKLESK